MINVAIEPGKKKLTVPAGTLLLDILHEAGMMINTPCGGKGNCGKCKVMVSHSSSRMNETERRWLSEEEIKKGFRLACQYRLESDVTITVPSYSLINKENATIGGKIKSHLLDNHVKPAPQIKKIYLHLNLPTLLDQRSDWTRIQDGLRHHLKQPDGSWAVPIEVLNSIPRLLRSNDFKITIVMNDTDVIAVEAGDTRDELYGIAFDIGTTTIAGYLLHLSSGKELAVEACGNPQSRYGDDVITRIDFSQKNPRGIQKLQQELIAALNQLISTLTNKAGVDDQKIYLAVLVGNTCMHHFLWSLPTEKLAISPYVPVMIDSIWKESRDLPRLALRSHARIYTAPNISAYVGGDIIADMIDISVWRKAGTTLMVDLGTNGEIILAVEGKIWTCSAAAGPAFEGARISSGMRATLGAIDQVKIKKQRLSYHVIGQAKAIGLCGSGIIELIAELLKIQIMQPNGRLLKQEECPEGIKNNMKERMVQEKKYNQFMVVPARESDSGEPIYLTQKDIREIQLAKGAVAAGIRILLEKAEVEIEKIDEILLAGAFGNVLDTRSALDIGIIPHISLDKIRSIGNAAGQGAEKMLLSEDLRLMADRLSKKVQYIELSSHQDFQKVFAESLFFSHFV